MIGGVLIVDDDKDITETLREFFLLYGLSSDQIFTCSDPLQALEIFNAHKDKVSLLICDYYMPITNGPELCELLKSSQPNLSVILQTGDSNIEISDLKGIDTILLKPFTYDTFKSTIDSKKYHLPEHDHARQDVRSGEDRHLVSVILSKAPNLSMNAIVFNQSKNGCGIIISSFQGLDVGDEIDLLVSHIEDKTKKIHQGRIAWVKHITTDMIKVGIEYIKEVET